MMEAWSSAALPLLGLLACGIPLAYALAAAWVSDEPFSRRARWAVRGSFGLALAVSVGWAVATHGASRVVSVPPLEGALAFRVRLDVVTGTMLVLVTFIALVILRYSRTYLAGEPGRARFVRWLMATLAAVSLLVIANNLLVIAVAWIGTSLALHQLLTFYPDRTQALVAAHKKFLASRVADLCLASAIAIVGVHVGSLDLEAVYAWSASVEQRPVAIDVASVLFVLGAALKCAQLPFHGWLTQVMEAPTPVSALLHAGVVNIGGFLMIRLSPLMASADVAQTLLVVLGSATAVVAALVMTTRVSIKVMLAWSTIAQMGFMLVQCGLGAYQLALLHIVAHSLYKAHAFLSSGSVVDGYRAQVLVKGAKQVRLGSWFAAGAAGVLGVTGVVSLFGARPSEEPALWAFALVVALATAPLLVRGAQRGLTGLTTVALGSAAVAALYFTWHALAGWLVAVPAQTEQLHVRVGIVIASFGALFVLQGLLQAHPGGRLARALYPRLFAGLYLDEIFTRLTFRLWPPRLPPRNALAQPISVADIVEA